MSTPFRRKPHFREGQRPAGSFLLNLRQVGTLLVALSLIVQSLGLFSFVPAFSSPLVAQAATLAQSPTPAPSSSQGQPSKPLTTQERQDLINKFLATRAALAKNGRVTIAPPQPAPSFNQTLYANDKMDDDVNDANGSNCPTSTNTTCTLRDAITEATKDLATRNTKPDLIVLVNSNIGNFYNVTQGVLPNVPDYVYFTDQSDPNLSCTIGVGAFIGTTNNVTYDGLHLGNHDYLNNVTIGGFQNGIVITGTANTLTCQIFSLQNNNDGLVVGPGATNNQIGGVFGTDVYPANTSDVFFIGNIGNGVTITGTNTTNNRIENASIGYFFKNNPYTPLGSQISGIEVAGGANNNFIGVALVTETNIIANNGGSGILITGTNTTANYVYNNQIGDNYQAANDNTAADHIANSNGIDVGGGASGNFIGGTGANQGNLISQNSRNGIILNTGASQNKISGNTIDTNPLNGVLVGIDSTDTTTKQNTISQNSIFDNANLGINLNYASGNGTFNGVDAAPNNAAQVPTITLATYSPSTGVKAVGTANANSTVELFVADSEAANAQGETYLGSTTANASGNFTITVNPPANTITNSNPILVATSTLNNNTFPTRVGSTSQFSAPFTATVATILTANPSTLNFRSATGINPNPASQTISLTAQGNNITYTTSVSYSGGANNWLTISPNSGTVVTSTATVVTATVSSATLAAGTYTATVTFADTDPNNSSDTATVTVTLTVLSSLLSATPPSLTFSTTVGTNPTPASQTISLTAQNASINYTTTVSYGSGASNWLTVNPSSGTVVTSTATVVSATVSSTALAAGTYTATVTFADTNPANSSDKVTVPVTLIVNSQTITSPTVYTYNLPFLANNYAQNGITGTFTTYLAFQNAGTVTATVNAQFYDASGNPISSTVLSSSPSCSPVPLNGECVLASNPFASGTKGSGVITSTQPLNVIVPEATPYGGSAYAITQGSSNSLVDSFAINNAFGDFVTQLNILNSGSVTTTANVTFYGTLIGSNALTSSTTSVNIAPHTTANLNQNTLPSGFSGWAQITSTNSTLVAQVLEQSPSNKFVAIANAVFTPSATLYAPAIFNSGYGSFYTGADIINPNNTAVTVTVSYYNKDTNQVTPTAPFQIQAHGLASIYQGSTSGGIGLPSGGLPSGFVGAAVVTSTGGGVVMSVNENGGLTSTGNDRSGVYAATPSGGSTVGLPVISNGGYTYVTGFTVFNTSSQPVTATVNYYTPDGKIVSGASQTFNITANGSYGLYQGASSLPSGFYGTAFITESNGSPANALIVTTNAQNAALFYTYSEPNP